MNTKTYNRRRISSGRILENVKAEALQKVKEYGGKRINNNSIEILEILDDGEYSGFLVFTFKSGNDIYKMAYDYGFGGKKDEPSIKKIESSRRLIKSSQKGMENVVEGTQYDDYHIDTKGMGILSVENIIEEIEGRGNQAVLTVQTSDGSTNHSQFSSKDWKEYKDSVNNAGNAITDVWVTEVEGGSYVRNSRKITSSYQTAINELEEYFERSGSGNDDEYTIYTRVLSRDDENHIAKVCEDNDCDFAIGTSHVTIYPIESSRKITSARYIATDPESGEVLGSADTYEEAVNEWGEDVTITDSEVGDGTDETQGGILSSYDTQAAYEEGREAFFNHKTLDNKPIALSKECSEAWEEGWKSAAHGESNHQFNQRIVNSVLTKEITENEAIKQIASRNNMNIGFAKRILSNLLEDKSLIQSGVMEMADDMNKEFNLNGDLYSWFDDYVDDNGNKSTTVGGELVRAAHQIIGRFENDGDKIGMGYGKETVNPAARYILAICNDYIDRNDIEEMLWNESRINYSDEEYDAWIQQFERTFTDYLRDHEELFHASNKNDMWDYKEEDDVNSSVTECCIYDDNGNEYWFQRNENNEWKCTSIEFNTEPEYNVDETFSSASDFEEMIYSKGEQKEPYGFFSENGLTYNWEGIVDDDEGNYREWVITDVSVDGGLADVGDVWSADDFDGYGVYDANGREINVSELY